LKICLFIVAECTNVRDTERQADGQTPHDGSGRACIASRGKKIQSTHDTAQHTAVKH